MGVSDGQYANENTFNSAFMARNTDTDTSGKVSLLNSEPESGPQVANLQGYMEKLADTVGTSETDVNAKNYSSNNYIADGDNRKVALEKLDTKAKDLQDQVDVHETRLDAHDVTLADHESRLDTLEPIVADHETRLDAAEITILDHESRLDTIETANSSFSGNKTFNNDVEIVGNLTVQGTTTTINSTVTQVADPSMTLNNGGTNGTAEGGGIEIERPAGNAGIQFDSTLASFFKIGLLSNLREVIVNGVAQVVGGLKDFINGIKTDSVVESTLDAGVTVDGVLIKDGLVDNRDVSADGTTQDNHIADSSIHYPQTAIDHTLIQNIGTNSHAQIDSHIANTSNPHSVTAVQVGLGNVTNDAQLKRSANDWATFTEKLSVANDDLILIEDSADSFSKKRVKRSNFGGGSSGAQREHVFRLNGNYSFLTLPANGQDTLYRFNVACRITNVILVREVAGSAGTTDIDVKVRPPAGAWDTIFTTTPKITAAAGNDAGVGVGEIVPNTTSPVLSSNPFNVAAGTLMRMDLLGVESGNPSSISVIVIFEPQ